MRVNTGSASSGGGNGGVIAGVYPNPMFMQYYPIKGFEKFADASDADGVLIPSNYNDSALQTAVDGVYDDIQALYPNTLGPIADAATMQVKAGGWASSYVRSKTLSIAPYCSLDFDTDGYPCNNANHYQIFKTDTDKFGVMWLVAESDYYRFYFKIADRSSGKIVWGDAQMVTGVKHFSSTVGYWNVIQSATDEAVIFFGDDDNSGYASAVAFNLDASDLLDTVGAILEVEAASSKTFYCTEYVAANKVFAGWDDDTTTAIFSVDGSLNITKGTTKDISGTNGSTTKGLVRYLADDKLLYIGGDVSATGYVRTKVITVSTTTMTNQTENSLNFGSGSSVTNRGAWALSATEAIIHFSYSSAYRLWYVSVSGNTATLSSTNGINTDSNDRFMGNRQDNKFYRIDTNATPRKITKYSATGSEEASFTDAGLSWGDLPTTTDGTGDFQNKDLRDGISINEGPNASTTIGSFNMISKGNDVDVSVNGASVYSNTGADTFGLTVDIDADLSSASVLELIITNQSGALRCMQPSLLIATVT